MNSVLTVGCLLLALPGVASDRVDVGSDMYHVVINDVDRGSLAGFFAAYTGALHPVTLYAGRPGEVTALRRDCLTCAGTQDATFAVIRSYTSGVDYTLGSNPTWLLASEPGFTCISANDLGPPLVEDITTSEPAVRATWFIHNASDDFRIEEILRVHGADLPAASIEVTLRVENTGTAPTDVGIRTLLVPRISHPVTPSSPAGGGWPTWFVGTRAPDPPLEPFLDRETSWEVAMPRMWQIHGGSASPSTTMFDYFVAGAVAGPDTLEPPSTPPDLLQVVEMNIHPPFTPPGGGATDACFIWPTPDPPRPRASLNQMGVVSTWGPDEASAHRLSPGDSAAATQHLVAFLEYPLSVDAGDASSAPCSGARTEVGIAGRVELTTPSSAEVRVTWSADDPAVTFSDASQVSTSALVPAPGTYLLHLTARIGAYQATDTTTITITDEAPPVIASLEASPATLWPPNHRLVPVEISATVIDECDPSPALRLVSVSVNEPDDERGDGATTGDVADAEIGTDDRHVLLRAERSGTRGGRSYLLTYEATDWSGNTSSREVMITVPHDRRSSAGPARPPRVPPRRP